MADIFDRLLRQIQGNRRFAPPFAPPFPVPIQKAPIKPEVAPPGAPPVPTPTVPTEERPEVPPTVPRIPMPLITTEPKVPAEEVPVEKEVKEPRELRQQRRIQQFAEMLQPKPKPKASFWQKLVKPVMGAMSWVEKVDATTYGLVKGTLMAAIHGNTLREELDAEAGQGTFEAAKEYTRRHKLYERLLGEIIISPFNLIPVGMIFKGAGKGMAVFSATMARQQVLGAGLLRHVKPFAYTQAGLRARTSHRLSDYMKDLVTKEDIIGRNAIREPDGIVRRMEAFATGDVKYLSRLYPERDIPKWLGRAESKEVQAYFTKAINTKYNPLKFSDLRHPGRSAAQIEKDIYTRVLQAAAPMSQRAAQGELLYSFHRRLVRELTPFLLLVRPAYTVYNQMMNMFMVLLRHPMRTMQYMASPKMKGEVKALWGMVDPPLLMREGFGHSYVTAQEQIDKGIELVEGVAKISPSELPLIGMGQFWKGVRRIKGEYKRIPHGMRPMAEKYLPLMGKIDAWARGVNVAGEQFFRSADFAFTHLKTFRHIHGQQLRHLGVKSPMTIELAKYPDELAKLMDGQKINPAYILSREGLEPSQLAMLDNRAMALAPDSGPQDIIATYKGVSDDFKEYSRQLRRVTALHGGVDDVARVLDEQGLEEMNRVLRELKIEGDDAFKQFIDGRPEAERMFNERVRTNQKMLNEAESKFNKSTGSVPFAKVHEEARLIHQHYTNEMTMVAARHHAEVRDMYVAAHAKGEELLQKEVGAIYGRMRNQQSAIVDLRSKEVANLYDRAAEAVAKRGGVDIDDLDLFPSRIPLEDAKKMLRDNGLPESLIDDGPFKVDDALSQFESEGLRAIDNAEAESLSRYEGLLREGRVPAMDWSKVRFVPAAEGSAKAMDISLEMQARMKRWVEKLPVELRSGLKEIRIDPAPLRRMGPLVEASYDKGVITIKNRRILKDETTFMHEMGHAISRYRLAEEAGQFQVAFAKEIIKLGQARKLAPPGIKLSAEERDTFEHLIDQSAEIAVVGPGRYSYGQFLEFEETLATSFMAYAMRPRGGVTARLGTKWRWMPVVHVPGFWKKHFPSRNIPGAPATLREFDLHRARNSAMSYSYREGIRTAENDLFNYGTRTNLDYLASTLMPYPYWSMRFALHWGLRAVDNPGQLNALIVLMKTWQEEAKDLPAWAMSTPIALTLPDGSQVRFSPFTWFFPLGYGGMDILRYGEQINNTVDAVSNVQDFVGGYLFPTWELALSLGGEFGMPGYQTRGTGIARSWTEIVKDIVPQTRLLRGAMSFSPAAVKWSLEHGAFNEREIHAAIYAIGDDLNSGTLTNIAEAEEAIQSLQDSRAHPLAIKYLCKTLKRNLQTGSARYMGLPVSRWYPEQKKSWQIRQLIRPQDARPASPEIRQAMAQAYPGIEVVRGKVTPAGLDRKQERKWKASQEYFRTTDEARTRLLETQMAELMESFETPKPGATMSPSEFMERRRGLYTEFGAITNQARITADQRGAPIDRDDREAFWQDVGRPVWPRHPLDDILEEYYQIEVELFPGTTALETDWQAFFKAREDFLMSLPPWQRAWLEDYINDPTRPDADFIKAQDLARQYWAVREMLIAENPDLEELLQWMDYYEVADPDMLEVYRRTPTYKRFTRLLKSIRLSMRRNNPELDAVLVKYWGLRPVKP